MSTEQIRLVKNVAGEPLLRMRKVGPQTDHHTETGGEERRDTIRLPVGVIKKKAAAKVWATTATIKKKQKEWMKEAKEKSKTDGGRQMPLFLISCHTGHVIIGPACLPRRPLPYAEQPLCQSSNALYLGVGPALV